MTDSTRRRAASWYPLLAIALRGACLLAIAVTTATADEPKPVDFAHDIVPIVKTHCAKCHTDGASKGKFSLDTRESMLKSKAVVPGKAGESELIERLTSEDPEFIMPPKGERLTREQVARMRAWIEQGASWEAGFTFKRGGYAAPLKLRRPTLPSARPGREHPIDRIIDAYYERNGVKPPEPLDDAGFVRRVSLDLIGLLPRPEKLETFLKDDPAVRRDKLIRRLLDDRRGFAVHWLTFWNDLLRNDYRGVGYVDGGRRQITGWLYQALLENTPYNRFVTELISPTSESEGFVYGIIWRGRTNASQTREVQFSQNVSQVFFGINMKCASCHDSFIDHWKLEEAYGLAAVVAEKPLEIYRCDKPTGKTAVPKFLWPELGAIDAEKPRSERLEQLAGLITSPDNGRFSRTIVNRIWQRLMGRGIVHPVDVMANEPWSAELLDYLAGYLVDQGYDLKRLMEHIASSKAYQSRAVAVDGEIPVDRYVFRGPAFKRMTAEQFIDAVWQLTEAGPKRIEAPVRPASTASGGSLARPFVRAALVNADPLMRSLGRPNREQVVTTRGEVLTTLQALELSNGQVLTQTLAVGASNRLKRRPAATPDEQIEALYLHALSRQPTPEERDAARELVGKTVTQDGLADLLWAVAMLPEFQLIR